MQEKLECTLNSINISHITIMHLMHQTTSTLGIQCISKRHCSVTHQQQWTLTKIIILLLKRTSLMISTCCRYKSIEARPLRVCNRIYHWLMSRLLRRNTIIRIYCTTQMQLLTEGSCHRSMYYSGSTCLEHQHIYYRSDGFSIQTCWTTPFRTSSAAVQHS
jgi:hypothetical protein